MHLNEGYKTKIYEVVKIDLPLELERRLEALGMTLESKLEVIDKKGKGIMIVKIRGTRFALGENITKNTEVKEIS